MLFIVFCHISFWEIVFAAVAEQSSKECKYKESKNIKQTWFYSQIHRRYEHKVTYTEHFALLENKKIKKVIISYQFWII